MLLFIDNSDSVMSQVIIPISRLYDIWSYGCRININYDSGELVEVEGTYQKKIESLSIVCESEDVVNKLLRQFYKACNNKAGAFYFGTGKD